MLSTWLIIGIDCAVEARKTAIACADLRCDKLAIREAVLCSEAGAAQLASTMASGSARTLFALDAPLGWPIALGTALARHHAGTAIAATGHSLFRRRTDEIVKRETGQQPLDVGADRIARTAGAALMLLDDIRRLLGRKVPLAWTSAADESCAIEVYPAATLRQFGIEPRSYKKSIHAPARETILQNLAGVVDVGAARGAAVANADVLDDIVCVIAGADFLRGACRLPTAAERQLAERKGWIWFRA